MVGSLGGFMSQAWPVWCLSAFLQGCFSTAPFSLHCVHSVSNAPQLAWKCSLSFSLADRHVKMQEGLVGIF